MQLSQQEYNVLKERGYSDEQIKEALRMQEAEELQQSYKTTQNTTDPRTYASMSSFAGGYGQQDNLIKWQLELDNILERAEHILRGDVLKFKDGHTIWTPAELTAQGRILSEYGVQEVMRVLSMYLNRNTILGDYDKDEIEDKVFDFGMELKDLFYMKYEEIFEYHKFADVFEAMYGIKLRTYLKEYIKINFYNKIKEFFGAYSIKNINGRILVQIPMGGNNQKNIAEHELSMDMKKILVKEMIKDFIISEYPVAVKVNEHMEALHLEKRKNYPMIMREMVDMVHSSYTRALHGGERRSLREARSITQSEALAPQGININTGQVLRERGMLNPLRYVIGKYK